MSKNKGSDISKILHERVNKFISGEFREELRDIIYEMNQTKEMKDRMENLGQLYDELGYEREPNTGDYTYDDVDNDLCRRVRPWMEGYERWFPEDYIQAFDIYFNNTKTWDAINSYGNNISHTRHVNALRTMGKEFSPLESEFSAKNLLKIFHEYGFDIAELDHKNNVMLKDLIDYKLEHGMLSLEELKEVAEMPEHKDKVDPEEIKRLEEQEEALADDGDEVDLDSTPDSQNTIKPDETTAEPLSEQNESASRTNQNPYSQGAKTPRESAEQGGMSTPANNNADKSLQSATTPSQQAQQPQQVFDPLSGMFYGVGKGISSLVGGAKNMAMSAFGANGSKGGQAPSLVQLGKEMTIISGSLPNLSEQDRIKAYSTLDDKTAAFNEIANFKSKKMDNRHAKKDLEDGMELFKQTSKNLDDFKKANERMLTPDETTRLEQMKEKLDKIQEAIAEAISKFVEKISSVLSR